MGEIKSFLSSCTLIFDHIFYCAFFIILILVGIDKKENQFGMISFLWYENSQKVTKRSQNLLEVLPKTVLFRKIALIFSKTVSLENCVVKEPCKPSARVNFCIQYFYLAGIFAFFSCTNHSLCNASNIGIVNITFLGCNVGDLNLLQES